VYVIDLRTVTNDQTTLGLNWARQIVSQSEALISHAQERLEDSSIEWVIRSLAVGPENRPVQIALLKPDATVTENEKYRYHSKTGLFSYIKVLDSTTGAGIRLHIHLRYIGFLGAHTPLANDLGIGAFFILCCLSLLYLLKPLFGKSTHPDLSDLFEEGNGSAHSSLLDQEFLKDAAIEIKRAPIRISSLTPIENIDSIVLQKQAEVRNSLLNLINPWITEARGVLMQLGLHVRDMTKEAQVLATTAGRSRDSVERLSVITSELKGVTQSLETGISQTTANSVEESLKLLAIQAKELAEKSCSEAETALKSYETFSEVTQHLSGHITQTKESLLNEARMMQSLKDRVFSQNNKPQPIQDPGS
jgi:hypothetical protein